jgi:hypothetical protein
MLYGRSYKAQACHNLTVELEGTCIYFFLYQKNLMLHF